MLVCLAANAQTNNYSMVTSTSELYEGAKVILVGFNEKNRKAVQAMPGVTRFADGLIAFLKQKI